ncbi:MAG: ECF-type sigma factor [Planctomycetota bacterium]
MTGGNQPDPTPGDGAAPSGAPQGKPVNIHQMTGTMYLDMRRIGGNLMKSERRDANLTPTALVNTAVERMLERGQHSFNDRAHLIAAAAMQMRRELVDHARARGRIKRGGGRGQVSWDDVAHLIATRSDADLQLSLEQVTEHLSRENERFAQLLSMHVYGGMTQQDMAKVLGVSLSTVEKDLRYVKERCEELLGITPAQ